MKRQKRKQRPGQKQHTKETEEQQATMQELVRYVEQLCSEAQLDETHFHFIYDKYRSDNQLLRRDVHDEAERRGMSEPDFLWAMVMKEMSFNKLRRFGHKISHCVDGILYADLDY